MHGAHDRAAIANRKVAELEKRVPRLTVHVAPDAPRDTTVALDGVVLGASNVGAALPVETGDHRVEVTASGRAARAIRVVLAEGERLEVLAEPGSVPEPEATAPPPVLTGSRSSTPSSDAPLRDRPADRSWPRWTSIGVGVAGLVTAAVFGALALDRRASVASDCPDKQCRDPYGVQAGADGQRFEAAALTALGIGIAGVGVGGYLFLAAPGPQGPVSAPAAAHGAALRIAGTF
jgi:hypothetical protein